MDSTEVALYVLIGIALLGSGASIAHGRALRKDMERHGPPRQKMSKDEIRQLAEMVGFLDSNIAAAVALAESGGNPKAVGDNGLSIGLWQIYTKAHPQYARADLFDPLKNAHAALAISDGGKNWRPWTTFRNGAYKAYL